MSTLNQSFSEQVAVVSTIDPQVITNTSVNADYVDMSRFGRIAFVVNVGNIDVATTVDVALYEASDSLGTGAQAVAGKAITQLSATDDNKQVILELADSELSAGFGYVGCRVTVAGTSATVSVVGLGLAAHQAPAKNHDLASVAQIVGG